MGVQHRWSWSLSYDYGQFYLISGDLDAQSLSDSVEHAIDRDGIAQNGPLLVVLVPHQMNAQMEFVVEQYNEVPPDDAALWDEVFEAVLSVHDGVRYSSPASDAVTAIAPVADGHWAARICGRGIVAHGWPGSATPGDVWRLQLWPTGSRDEEPAHRKAWWSGL